MRMQLVFYKQHGNTVMSHKPSLPRQDINISSLLEKQPLFKDASPDLINRLSEQSQIIRTEKNQILFVHGEPATRFFLIIEGWVKLFRETLDGAQAVVDILPKDSFLGEISLLPDSQYASSAETIEPSLLISLPLSHLKKEMEESPKLALAMLRATTLKDQDKERELEHKVLQNAPQRIACFLLRLTDQTKKGHVTIHLPYDKTLIAARLGMQPETFSRALAKLKKITGLQIKGGTVEMESLEPLATFACSACSSQFPCRDLRSQNNPQTPQDS